MKTVKMTWYLGPGRDWLAYAEGLNGNCSEPSKDGIDMTFVKATLDTWMTPAIYNLAVDTFYLGQRNGEPVYFYITVEGTIKRFTEFDFVDEVYKRYEVCQAMPEGDGPLISLPDLMH